MIFNDQKKKKRVLDPIKKIKKSWKWSIFYSFGSCKRIFKDWIFEIQIYDFPHELWKKLRFCSFFSIKNRFFSNFFHFLALFFYQNRFFRIWQEFWCSDLFDFSEKKIVFSRFQKNNFQLHFFSLFFPEKFFSLIKKTGFCDSNSSGNKIEKKYSWGKFLPARKFCSKFWIVGEKSVFFSKTSSVRTDEIFFRKTSKNETKFCEKIFDSERKNHFFWKEFRRLKGKKLFFPKACENWEKSARKKISFRQLKKKYFSSVCKKIFSSNWRKFSGSSSKK